MSNGTACCAEEICCPPADARATVRKALTASGLTDENCDAVFAYMDHESLMFAHVSLREHLQHVAEMARKGMSHV